MMIFAIVVSAGSNTASTLVAAREMVSKFPLSPPSVSLVQFFISRFTAEDAKDLSALCSHISVALENIKRADEADEVSIACFLLGVLPGAEGLNIAQCWCAIFLAWHT